MMKRPLLALVACLTIALSPIKARADIFGGDVLVLTQILVQSVQTVLQLKQMIQTGADTLNLLRDANAGLKSGLDLIRIVNPNFKPGVFGDLRDPNSALQAIRQLYGPSPSGADQQLIDSQDQSVAEVISMNRNLYDYADQVDRDRDRILFHAEQVNPQGAAKLENQSLAILIGVTTQLLRTQGQMLKLMAQNMAFQNRKEKLSSQNFQDNYQSLSTGLGGLPKNVKLPSMGGEQ